MNADDAERMPTGRIAPIDDDPDTTAAIQRALQAMIQERTALVAEAFWRMQETGEAFIQLRNVGLPRVLSADEVAVLQRRALRRLSPDASTPDTTKPYPLDDLPGRIDDLTT